MLDVILSKLLFIKSIVDKALLGFVLAALGVIYNSFHCSCFQPLMHIPETPDSDGTWVHLMPELGIHIRAGPPDTPSRWSAHHKTEAESLEMP